MNPNQTGVQTAPIPEINRNIQLVNSENQPQSGNSESLQSDQTEQVIPAQSETTVNQGEVPVGDELNSDTEILRPEILATQANPESSTAALSSLIPSAVQPDSKASVGQAYNAVTFKAETLSDMDKLATEVANLGWDEEPQK